MKHERSEAYKNAIALHADIRNIYLGHEGDRKKADRHLERIVRIQSASPLTWAERATDRMAVIDETQRQRVPKAIKEGLR